MPFSYYSPYDPTCTPVCFFLPASSIISHLYKTLVYRRSTSFVSFPPHSLTPVAAVSTTSASFFARVLHSFKAWSFFAICNACFFDINRLEQYYPLNPIRKKHLDRSLSLELLELSASVLCEEQNTSRLVISYCSPDLCASPWTIDLVPATKGIAQGWCNDHWVVGRSKGLSKTSRFVTFALQGTILVPWVSLCRPHKLAYIFCRQVEPSANLLKQTHSDTQKHSNTLSFQAKKHYLSHHTQEQQSFFAGRLRITQLQTCSSLRLSLLPVS